MNDSLLQSILKSKSEDISDIFDAALKRYKELFPEWDITVISVVKTKNRNDQLDEIIALLNKMKQPG